MRIEHNGQDVTAAVQADDLLLIPYPLTPGPAIQFLTAGCIVQLVRALFSDEESFIHVPAPDGLPGGYPVMVSKQGVQPGLTLNAKALRKQLKSKMKRAKKLNACYIEVRVNYMILDP